MSLFDYNGGCCVAMAGKNCVAIAADTRYGIRYTTVGKNTKRIFKMNNKTFLGLVGLATDVTTVYQKLKFRMNLYKLREDREINPGSFSNCVSSFLYEKRFAPWYINPIIAGLDKNNKPFLCNQDLIGACSYDKNFVVSGTCSDALFGLCESLYKPNMEPNELFEVISQSLLASVDRDCYAGWGGVVYIITPDKIIKKTLKVRQD